MTDRQCNGEVHSLRDRTICFTGRVHIDGVWTVRDKCKKRARDRGATPKTDFSRKVTLVVFGDLTSKAVSDTRRNYGDTLVDAELRRRQGHHVCVVNEEGFSHLLQGRSAACLELRRAEGGHVHPVSPTPPGTE